MQSFVRRVSSVTAALPEPETQRLPLQGAYPARLKKVLIVSAPLWFKAPFRILRLFVREKLRDRVSRFSLESFSLLGPFSRNKVLAALFGHKIICIHKSTS